MTTNSILNKKMNQNNMIIKINKKIMNKIINNMIINLCIWKNVPKVVVENSIHLHYKDILMFVKKCFNLKEKNLIVKKIELVKMCQNL